MKFTHPDIASLVTPLCFAKRGRFDILFSSTLFTRSVERVGHWVSNLAAIFYARKNQTLPS